MSNPNEDVYGSDEAHHGDSVRRSSDVMTVVEASGAVVEEDGKIRGHKDMTRALGGIGCDAVVAGANSGGAGVVGGNEGIDVQRKGSRREWNWDDSRHL